MRQRTVGERGMTLVELMVVVAIIGVLAAIAMYMSVLRYLASAKTAEAKQTLGAIGRAAVTAYERETVASEVVPEGASAFVPSHALCNSAIAVPLSAAAVKSSKYQPSSSPGADFETGDPLAGWKCLKFAVTSPIYFQYSYVKGASSIATGVAASTVNGFEAGALGDLDGDGLSSKFALTGEVNLATGTVRLSTQLFVSNEFE